MDIRERQQDGMTVIELSGRLTVNDRPGMLKGAVGAAVERGARQVVLDLSNVKYIDSTRLGELIAAHVTLSRLSGQLRLAATPARVIELFTMAGLDGVFARYDSVKDAVAATA
jgi:anti-sigma B factor antagonist